MEVPSFVRCPNLSVDTQYSVPLQGQIGGLSPEEKVQKALLDLEEVMMIATDDFSNFNTEDLAWDHLKEQLVDAERLK